PRRLPHLKLGSRASESDVPIIWRRSAPILLFLHSEACPACSEFVERVAGFSGAIAEWDGRPLIIVPGATTEARSGSMIRNSPFPILEDSEARLQTALRVEPPAVIIADQWGEIYERLD